MRRMKWFPVFLALLSTLVGIAYADEKKETSMKRSAVSDQEIQLEFFYDLALDCKPNGEIRVAVLTPPKNGKITARPIEVKPTFRADNPRAACNKDMVTALAVYYQAKTGFRGTDKFRFAFVFRDGDVRIRNVETTVWGN